MDAILVYGGMAFTVVLLFFMWIWFGRGGKHVGDLDHITSTTVDSRM
jgi:hypothetical protein